MRIAGKYVALAAITSTVVVLDQVAKWMASHWLAGRPVAVVENFFHLRFAQNPGGAWGLLGNLQPSVRIPLFVGAAVVALVLVLVFFRYVRPGQKLLVVAFSLVLGGAIGNLIDRIRLGKVIDYIDWHWYESARWPTFNVADIALTFGVVFLALEVLSGGPGKEPASDGKAGRPAGATPGRR